MTYFMYLFSEEVYVRWCDRVSLTKNFHTLQTFGTTLIPLSPAFTLYSI